MHWTLFVAVACGKPAAHEPKPAPVGPSVYVVVAEAPPGTVLTEAHVQLQPLAAEAAHGGLTADVLGRTASEALYPGEPVLAERLAPLDRDGVPGLPGLVPRGQRLHVIQVPPASTLGLEVDSWIQLVFLAGEGVRTPPQNHRVLSLDHDGAIGLLRSPQDIALSSDEQAIPVLPSVIEVTHVDEHGPATGTARKGAGSAIAIRPLAPGVILTEADLAALDTAYDGAPRFDELVGARPRSAILPGELVRGVRLADPHTGAGMAATVPRGMVTLGVPAPPGSAIQPGSYVDVFGASEAHQAVFVMARADGQLSLLLTPGQAADLARTPATWRGDLQFALRNDLDMNFIDLRRGGPE